MQPMAAISKKSKWIKTMSDAKLARFNVVNERQVLGENLSMI